MGKRIYSDVGFAEEAIRKAQDNGTLREFRVKYLPAACACCGKHFDKGTKVVSPERGILVGRCCWWPSERKRARYVTQFGISDVDYASRNHRKVPACCPIYGPRCAGCWYCDPKK